MRQSYFRRPTSGNILGRFLFAACALGGLSACLDDAPSGHGLVPETADQQDVRAKVALDFAKQPDAAKREYSAKWQELVRRQNLTTQDKVLLAAIATEMMAAGGGAEYERVVLQLLDDGSPEVVGGALAALASSRRLETVSILERFAGSAESRYATEAVNALFSRRLRASREPARADEFHRLEAVIAKVCGTGATSAVRHACAGWQR